MAFVPLTVTISLCLTFTLVVFILREYVAGRSTKLARTPVQSENRPASGS